MLGQHLAHPTDQAGSSSRCPRRGDVAHVDEHLGPGESAALAVLVLELGLEHLGHQVVGRVLRPPVDVLPEQPLGVGQGVERLRRGMPVLVQHQAGVDRLADRLLIGLGDPEQHPDRPHRHLRAQIRDEVEPARAHQRVEGLRAELPDLRLDRHHPLRCEDPGQDPTMDVVDRRVLEQHVAGRKLDPVLDHRLDDLEQHPLGGAVGLPVRQARLDVVESAQRVEVERLVVVERRFLA